jgi:hypothetical protein
MTGNSRHVRWLKPAGRKDGSQPPFDTRLARAMSALPPKRTSEALFQMSAMGQRRTLIGFVVR